MRLLIAGLGDGGIHAIKPQTGEKVWSFVAAKRAINTGVVVKGTSVIVSHGDENLDTNELGMIAAIDGSQTGDIKTTKWANKGDQFGFSSPVIDGSRVYEIENGSRLKAFDVETGRELWHQPLGTLQKAPLVLADGKLYVGSENGKFFIVRPSADQAEVLSEVSLPLSTNSVQQAEGTPEPILAGAAVSRGRVFFVSSDAVYAIGPKTAKAVTGNAVDQPAESGEGAPTLSAGVADRAGAQARPDGDAAREALRRQGTIPARRSGGDVVAAGTDRHGERRHVDDCRAAARTGRDHQGDVGRLWRAKRGRAWCIRCPGPKPSSRMPTRPCRRAGSTRRRGKYSVATLDGQKVLQKAPDNTIFKRVRTFIGPTDLVQLHVRGRCAVEHQAAPDGRPRHHRAALFAGALWQLGRAEARAVDAGDPAHRHREVSPGRPTPGTT